MTPELAARCWAVLATLPIAYPNTAWRLGTFPGAITVMARRARYAVGHAFAYIEFENHVAPDQWLAWEFERMVRELDRGERSL